MPLQNRLPSLLGRIAHKLFWMNMLVIALVSGSSWLLLERHAMELTDYRLVEAADILAVAVHKLHQVNNHEPFVLNDDEEEEQFVWQIVDYQTGMVHSRSEQAPANALATRPSAQPTTIPVGNWRVITKKLDVDHAHFLLVAQKQDKTFAIVSALLGRNVALIFGLTSLFSILVIVMVRRELRPLTRLTKSVKKFNPVDSSPVPLHSQWAELAPMAESINHMGQQLSQRILSERAFNMHASHAMRTPLAALKMQIHLARLAPDSEIREWVNKASHTIDRLIQIMTSLLTMFRSSNGAVLKSTMVRDLLLPQPDEAMSIEFLGLDTIDCDSDLFSGVLLNLLDNAREHGATRVRIKCALFPNGWYSLFVSDNGRGCPTHIRNQLMEHLSQHNFDLESGLNGMGLMLADVVMSSHNGQVRLPAVDKGFCVELTWPGPGATQHNP